LYLNQCHAASFIVGPRDCHEPPRRALILKVKVCGAAQKRAPGGGKAGRNRPQPSTH
jgi:hypothetical protein